MIRNMFLLFLLIFPYSNQLLGVGVNEPNATKTQFDSLLSIIRSSSDYRYDAISRFAHLNDSRTVPVLIELLQDKSDSIRTLAAVELARLADKRAADSLALALNDKSANVRRYAAEGLAKVGSEKYVPALISAIIRNLPDSNQPRFDVWSLNAMLEATGRLAPTSSPQIAGLLNRISEGVDIRKDQWRLYESVAKCLGQIGDKAAYNDLSRAENILSHTYQDYQTWYAVRKALSQINPQNMPFNRPAADILYSVSESKTTEAFREKQWIQPLKDIGQEAIQDLDWALKFRGRNELERKMVCISALAEMGDHSSEDVLTRYIDSILAGFSVQKPPEMAAGSMPPGMPIISRPVSNADSFFLRETLFALVKVDPNAATIDKISAALQMLDGDSQKHLIFAIAGATPAEIPAQATISICKKMFGKQNSSLNVYAASEALVTVGGADAGTVLSEALLITASPAAALGLGKIKGYDAIPSLIKAAEMPNAPAYAIAQAMGGINDPRAIPSLEKMQARIRPEFREMDKIWIAAALAKFGRNYEENSAIVRNSFPAGVEAAGYLHDKETIGLLVSRIRSINDMEVYALEAMGNEDVLNALSDLMNTKKEVDPHLFLGLSMMNARIAQRLGVDTDGRYRDTALLAGAVFGLFEVLQQEPPASEIKRDNDIIQKHPELARELWIAEANRRLNLAKKNGSSNYESGIPDKAVQSISEVFSPKLVPIFERIVKEDETKVECFGQHNAGGFYIVRSLAAKILTDKTGKAYTFIDTDDRTHPGGWNPQMDIPRPPSF